jgi:hypothetical protein
MLDLPYFTRSNVEVCQLLESRIEPAGDGNHGLAAAARVRSILRDRDGLEEVVMRIHWGTTCLMFSLTAVLLGCSNYSAPDNTPTSADSTRDTTPPPPAYSR